MKNFLLKLFSQKELWEEIQRKDFQLPPELKEISDELYLRIKRTFPKFIDLLKIREYNLSRQIFPDKDLINFLNGQRFELRRLIVKLEETQPLKPSGEIQKKVEVFKKIDEGLKVIQGKITPK